MKFFQLRKKFKNTDEKCQQNVAESTRATIAMSVAEIMRFG